ncbi:hypothetical protein, partial [Streptomyces acidiscabies]|uniref:hypothetical protein n=1 Tax=Streptomyces acidiscabies TaxID=42234 RepID=UPI0038F7C955
MDNRGLLIKKGGNVDFYRWNTESRSYEADDVTGHTTFHLMEHVFFEEGLTLRDIFEVLNKEKELYDVFIGNWLLDY